MSFFSSLADTAKSLGGAVAAPYGAVWDLASAPFDDKDDNFGTIAAKAASRAGDLADPFFNQQTWTGAALGKTMSALDTAYREGVSEPLVAANTMAGHASYQVQHGEGIGDLFSSQEWGKAYDVAQHRSIGQSRVLFDPFNGNQMHDDGTASPLMDRDPMDDRAYKQIHANSPFTSSLGSGATDFAARWYLDPGIGIGKGVKAGKAAYGTRALTAEDRVGLADKMIAGEAKKRGIPQFVHNQRDIHTRTKQYLDWSDGRSAPELFYGTPELARSTEGKTIAGLLADANKFEDGTIRRDAKRRILAVAGGDVSQIKRLQDEIGEAGSIADALKNMKRGTSLELKTQALVPSAQHNPAFIADLQRQVDNLNTDESITKFVQAHETRLNSLLESSNTLKELPGVSAKGQRAVARQTGRGLSRNGEVVTGHDRFDAAVNKYASPDIELGRAWKQWAKDFADVPSASTVYQKSLHHVPITVIKTAGLAASPWTKMPTKITDALRQVHFQGTVDLHDWNSASDQLDSMMRIAGVEHGTRLKTLSEVYLAKSEPEKMRLIDRVEKHSLLGLWAKYGEKVDNPQNLEHKAFFEQLMSEGTKLRSQQLSQLRGRAYAATPQDPTLVGDAAKFAPRVDQILDDGTPVALPLIESQLANSVPLLDVHLAQKLIARDASYMSRLARSWKADMAEIGHLSRLKATGGSGLEKALDARRASADWAVFAAQKAMRLWKFSVLFRLGYPIRNVSDEHMRIWTQMRAMTFYSDNGREAFRNLAHNQTPAWATKALTKVSGHEFNTRRGQAARFIQEARIQKRELEEQLADANVEAYLGRKGEVDRTVREIASHKANITKWQRRLEEAEIKHSLGIRPEARTTSTHSGPTMYRGDDRNLRPGDVLTPHGGPDEEYRWGVPGDQNYVHLTEDPSVASGYTSLQSGGVYEVRPVGKVEPDARPEMKGASAHRAERAEVVRKLDDSELDETLPDMIPGWHTATERQKRADSRAQLDAEGVPRMPVADPNRGVIRAGDHMAALRENIRRSEDVIREKQGALDYLREQLGDDPDTIKQTLAGIEERLNEGHKAFKEDLTRRTVGSKDVVLPGGYTASGAYGGPYGQAWLDLSGSNGTFDQVLRGGEERLHAHATAGSHRTIQPDEAGHLDAWADVINHQFQMSKVARHFMRGKSVEEFVDKVKSPEWADLRERLPHYAHDPEDWGRRVQALVRDYLPTDDLRKLAVDGKVSPRKLAKMFPDMTHRPAVHGNNAAYNLGDVGTAARSVGRTMNGLFRYLGEIPTDRLTRHPYFNSSYKQHLTDLHGERLAAKKAGLMEYTQADVVGLERKARQLALHDLKRTLFDISAHSHAAHVMRFVSPFFAAHQESLSRWWRIVSDDPSVVRRFGLAFDMPRKVGLVYDSETGEPVKPGESISSKHRIMLRVPEAWGGKDTGADKWIDKHFHNWSVSENAFNLVLQGGLMNPGAGPLVTVPVEAIAEKYADQPEITRVARVLNPYPPDSPTDPLVPATLQRIFAFGKKEKDPEYARRYSTNAMDAMVDFEKAHGRPPTRDESDEIMLRAGRQTNVDTFLRVLWNGLSPAPARPESKYAVIQNGWYKISNQARTEGKDFEWARDRFVAKYGDVYLPLIYSTSLNTGNVPVSTEAVSQVKKHRALLRGVDPALTRMVLGAAGEGEYSPEARQWFKDAQMRPGDTTTYLSDRNPRQQLVEQVVRQGWNKYTALTGALTAMAQEQGLATYKDSDYLENIRKAAVGQMQEENPLWWNDYNDFNPTDYDQYLGDMQQIAKNSTLVGDTERQDVQVLKAYLGLREMVTAELARRKAAGLPASADAKANAPLMDAFAKYVGAMVEKSPDFEAYMYNGIISRDPYLAGG